ncbi:hypothetical protein [Variovorax sp. dw_954]|uniref:hypothetical protein n=1 Tax=Variovorax sp. dw_954 TaxID=2720078 RepID=UPI001BD34CE0|nr:hypothetical protein [Variovorax sp. dw_954]
MKSLLAFADRLGPASLFDGPLIGLHRRCAFSTACVEAHRLRMALFLLAGLLAFGPVHADGECRPLKQAIRGTSQAGYTGLFYANEIASDAGDSDGVSTRSALNPRVRFELEAMAAMSLDAGGMAEEAMDSGAIESGERERFVAQLRQRVRAGLLREHAVASWLVLLVNPTTRSGVLLARKYEFPHDGVDGVMNGAELVCVRERFEEVTFWSNEQPSIPSLLNGPERPDCGFALRARVGCAGLGHQLALAESQGESVFVTARGTKVLWVYTLNSHTGKGRMLRVRPEGTALLDTWLFSAEGIQ